MYNLLRGIAMSAISFLRPKTQHSGSMDELKEQTLALAKELQPWSDCVVPVAPEVDDLGRVALAMGFGPIRVALDFAKCDGNDHFVLEAFQGVMLRDGALEWRESERYVLRIAAPAPSSKPGGGEFVLLDDQPAARGRILHYSYEMSPFPLRLTLAQVSGRSKQLRYLVY